MKTIGNPNPGDHEAAPDPKCWSCFDTGVRAADSEPCGCYGATYEAKHGHRLPGVSQ